RPRVSPSLTKNETSSTAFTSATFRRNSPPYTGKNLLRCRTSSSAPGRISSASSAAAAGVRPPPGTAPEPAGVALVSRIGLHLRIVEPAAGKVARVGLEHSRRPVADGHLLGASRGEPGAFRHEPGVGHHGLDGGEALFPLRPQHWDGAQEPLGVRVAPPLKDVPHRAVLHHLPQI